MCCSLITVLKVTLLQRSSLSALPFLQMPCSFKYHTGATATFIILRLCESADSISDKVGRHVFFLKSRYRKVLLFISKAPKFRSRKTQWLNKSFNKAVQLTFYCQPRPQTAVGFVTHSSRNKCKLQILVTFFLFSA